MKRVFTLLFVLSTGLALSQSVIFSEDFNGVTTPALPTGWIEGSNGDWLTDDGSTVPSCNVAGSSGGNMAAAQNALASVEFIRSTSFSTTGFVNVFLQWNQYNANAVPSMTVEWSTNGTTWTAAPFTNSLVTDTWFTNTSTLQVSSAQNALMFIRFSYDADGSFNFIALDDIQVLGDPTPVFLWNGGPLHQLSSWDLNSVGSGTNATSFTSNYQTFYMTTTITPITASLTSNWTLNGISSKLVVGDAGLTSDVNFHILSGSTFSLNTAMLEITDNSSLTLSSTIFPSAGSLSLGVLSSVEYAQTSSVNITPTTYGNLTISGTNITHNASNLTVNGIFNLTTDLIMSNSAFATLFLNGVITGSGLLRTRNNSRLNIGGSGTFGTLSFGNGGSNLTLSQLTLNRSMSGGFVLGTNLTVNATTTWSNGTIDLNGNALTLNGAINFPPDAAFGELFGSPTSSFAVGGSSAGAITNSLYISQASATTKVLGALTMNRPSRTLILTEDLQVLGNTTLTNGSIDLNGKLLTLSGPIAFATTSAGNITGSASSSLTIDGSGSITNSLFMNPSSATSRQLNVFTMNRSGQTLTLGNTLETYGTVFPTDGIIASNGNLFIRSDATNKGRIDQVIGDITGNVRVETFALGGTTDWAVMGPSGISGLSVASWEGQIPMSCSLCPNDETSAGGYFVSIQGWDETAAASSTLAYTELNYGSSLDPGKGYWTYLGTGLGTTSDLSWTVTGPILKGAFDIPLTSSGPANGDGFNLISNPYPSAISWASLLGGVTGSVNDAIYAYNADLGITASYIFGVSVPPSAGALTDIIPMGQGFYVQALSATATLTAQESNKVASNINAIKPTNNIGKVINLTINGGGFSDATAIRFHDNATTAFDKKLDALKLFESPGYVGYPGAYNQRTTISTRALDVDYAVNSLPSPINDDIIIPVLVKVYATGSHTITASDLENIPNTCVILRDKLTNATHNLWQGPYVFNISDTTAAPRFELRVCSGSSPTSIKQTGLADNSNIFINKDVNGVFVKFGFDQTTKSAITVTNILGQKLVDDKTLNANDDLLYLNLEAKNQLIFVTVTTDKQKVTKKIIH
jgi:hypothetical protein